MGTVRTDGCDGTGRVIRMGDCALEMGTFRCGALKASGTGTTVAGVGETSFSECRRDISFSDRAHVPILVLSVAIDERRVDSAASPGECMCAPTILLSLLLRVEEFEEDEMAFCASLFGFFEMFAAVVGAVDSLLAPAALTGFPGVLTLVDRCGFELELKVEEALTDFFALPLPALPLLL